MTFCTFFSCTFSTSPHLGTVYVTFISCIDLHVAMLVNEYEIDWSVHIAVTLSFCLMNDDILDCPVCSKQGYKVPAGQNIQCYSESHPTGTYTWTDLTGGLVLTYDSTPTGAMLSTAQLIFGSVYQCTICSVCVPDVEVCCNQTYTGEPRLTNICIVTTFRQFLPAELINLPYY